MAADDDERHMARCLYLAKLHRGRTSPNPIVGCVIVDKRGRVIAEGAHEGPGQRHAEVVALAGRRAPGATLYVNLEPCNHHGRTPPCAPVVRDAGVARVVIGSEDPVPDHGGGIGVLRRAGIEVTVGVLREECERANLPFFTWAREQRAAFTLKAAITLDGKIATVRGESKWITGSAARDDVMRLRDRHDAVMVGIGTVLADDPALTARITDARDPVRVVVDSRLRTPLKAQVARPGTIIACTRRAPLARERALVARGVQVWRLGDARVDVKRLAKRLAAAGLLAVLVEGGGELHASLLAAGLGDELVIYIAPKLVGGPAKSWVGGDGIGRLAKAHRFELDTPVQLGDDVKITARRYRPAGLAVPVRSRRR
jgi:diaminohydroxyphosphoribosylaminopyrimidine deaminase / 5-amino-6-(5-phosphoribosylamino)uracil reductase